MSVTICQTSAVNSTYSKGGWSMAEVFSTEDKQHPMTCGIWTMEKGEPVTFKNPKNSFSYIIEGEVEMEDLGNPGVIVKLKAGATIYAQDGATIKWSSPSQGKAFGVWQLDKGADPEEYIQA